MRERPEHGLPLPLANPATNAKGETDMARCEARRIDGRHRRAIEEARLPGPRDDDLLRAAPHSATSDTTPR